MMTLATVGDEFSEAQTGKISLDDLFNGDEDITKKVLRVAIFEWIADAGYKLIASKNDGNAGALIPFRRIVADPEPDEWTPAYERAVWVHENKTISFYALPPYDASLSAAMHGAELATAFLSDQRGEPVSIAVTFLVDAPGNLFPYTSVQFVTAEMDEEIGTYVGKDLLLGSKGSTDYPLMICTTVAAALRLDVTRVYDELFSKPDNVGPPREIANESN